MKEMLKIAFVYAGCFLGAGYVSGQELYQFFGAFGTNGFWGVVFSFLLQFVLGIAVVRISMKTGIYEADKIIAGNENKWEGRVFGFFESFFMFGIFVIMSAGAGALINSLTGLDVNAAVLIFCVICAVFSLMGVEGMTKAFSTVVPLLVTFTFVIFLLCVKEKGFCFEMPVKDLSNPLLNNWFVSAGVFVSYNFFCSVAILAPVGVKVKSRKSAVGGVFLGCVFLALISLCIIISMNCFPESIAEELPMILVSKSLGGAFGTVYAVLLLCAMFSTSLSCIVATTVYIDSKMQINRKSVFAVIICAGGFLLGRIGFSQLISFVYPVCGYLGLFAMFGVLYNWLKGSNKNEETI